MNEYNMWLAYAKDDLRTADFLLSMKPTPREIICFHCQQAAEKALKSFLVLHDINPPKVHDVVFLCKLCSEIRDDFIQLVDACSELTEYGVQARYPYQLDLDDRDTENALKSAHEIFRFIADAVSQDGSCDD